MQKKKQYLKTDVSCKSLYYCSGVKPSAESLCGEKPSGEKPTNFFCGENPSASFAACEEKPSPFLGACGEKP